MEERLLRAIELVRRLSFVVRREEKRREEKRRKLPTNPNKRTISSARVGNLWFQRIGGRVLMVHTIMDNEPPNTGRNLISFSVGRQI